jgi:hypothetical protein
MDILTFEVSSVGKSLSTATDVQQLTIKHEETLSSVTWRIEFSDDLAPLSAYLRSTYVLNAYIGPPHQFSVHDVLISPQRRPLSVSSSFSSRTESL